LHPQDRPAAVANRGLVPAALLTDDITMTTAPLDLEAAKERYGATTRGGVGISFPALV
jgi:hypothetical protein